MSSSSSTTDGRVSVPMGLLPGFRFSPTDEELLSFYLKKKMEGDDSEFSHIIPEINVRKYEPRDLPEFFFSQPDRMTNSDSCNRTTDEGFYRITGQVRRIKDELSKAVIGEKRYMPFFKGRAPGHKMTEHVLHQFSLTKTELAKLGPNPNQQREFVLNHLTTKSANSKKRRYDSICNKLAEPRIRGYIASNYKDDQAAAAAAAASNMIPDECAESESANGSCLTDNNDNSTLHVGSPGGGFSPGDGNEAAYDPFHEREGNPILPFHPSSLQDIPLWSPVHTGLLGDVMYANNSIPIGMQL